MLKNMPDIQLQPRALQATKRKREVGEWAAAVCRMFNFFLKLACQLCCRSVTNGGIAEVNKSAKHRFQLSTYDQARCWQLKKFSHRSLDLFWFSEVLLRCWSYPRSLTADMLNKYTIEWLQAVTCLSAWSFFCSRKTDSGNRTGSELRGHDL